MKRLLFVSSRPIYPTIYGGRIRTAQQLEFLSDKYVVDVVYQNENNMMDSTKGYLPDVNNVTIFNIPKWKRILFTLRSLFNKLPLQINYYFCPRMHNYILSHIDEYDIVFCNNIRTAEYVREVDCRPIKVIDFVDAISMNYEKAKTRAKGLKRIIYSIDYSRSKEYEQAVIKKFNRCATISQVDKDYLMSKDIFVVGNKVDIPDEDDVSIHNNSNKIIFVGKMDYEPNVIAVSYFANQIFPILKNKNPNLNFIIVGINPCEAVKKLSRIDGVSVTGYVDSIIPYYQDSTIVVAPMLTGAGIQNKIIQAMAYGCCVVTTSIGAEGLNINKGEIGIFDSKDDMIAGIEFLLTNRINRIEMGKGARQYVKENLSLEAISKQFWNFMGDNGM